jgi:hypothetical protein
MTLVSLEVGELPGGDCDEVLREVCDHQEHRAEHLEVEALVRQQKIAAVLGEIIVAEYPRVPANIPVTTPSYQVKIIDEQELMRDGCGAGMTSPRVHSWCARSQVEDPGP